MMNAEHTRSALAVVSAFAGLLWGCTAPQTTPGTDGKTDDPVQTSPTSEPVQYGTVLTLHDGSTVSGELVHVYDMSNAFANAREEQFYALFNPRDFRPDPELDRSFRIISSNDIASIETYPPDPEVETYDDFVLAHDLVFERLPLDGVWSVHEDGTTYHRDEGGCGDFAWDFNVVDAYGHEHCYGTAGGCTNGANNHDYYAWQQPIYAPYGGRALFAYDTYPDNPPYTFPHDEFANGVAIEATGGFTLAIFHFAQDSVDVAPGNEVATDDYLGRVGNSGLSWAPHIHVGLFWSNPDAPHGLCHGWSVPSVFRQLQVSDGGASTEASMVFPRRGQLVSNGAF